MLPEPRSARTVFAFSAHSANPLSTLRFECLPQRRQGRATKHEAIEIAKLRCGPTDRVVNRVGTCAATICGLSACDMRRGKPRLYGRSLLRNQVFSCPKFFKPSTPLRS